MFYIYVQYENDNRNCINNRNENPRKKKMAQHVIGKYETNEEHKIRPLTFVNETITATMAMVRRRRPQHQL